MFRELYKKENDNLSLSSDFIDNLSKRMLEEAKKNPSSEGLNDNRFLSNSKLQSKEKEKAKFHFSPAMIGMCACISICCITSVIYLQLSSKNMKSSNSGAAGPQYDMESSFDSSQNTESAPLTESEKNLESSALEDSAAQDNFLADSNSLPKEEIHFDQIEEFIPTPSETLSASLNSISTSPIGSDLVQLDYVSDSRIVFHDYWGVIVYNLEERKVDRFLDLKDLLGEVHTQGDDALQVNAYKDGNYLLIETGSLPKKEQQDSNKDCYLYNIQTDQLTTLSYNELSQLNPPAFALTKAADNSFFKGQIVSSTPTSSALLIHPNKAVTLLYQAKDDPTIETLSILIASKKKDSTAKTTLLSIFPDGKEHAITQGYSIDYK